MKKIALILLWLFGYTLCGHSQNYAIQAYPGEELEPSVTFYPSYYNTLKICIANSPDSCVRIAAKGFRIIKKANLFYIRSQGVYADEYLKIFNCDTLVDSLRIFMNFDIPLPVLRFYKHQRSDFNIDYWEFDSLYVSHIFSLCNDPHRSVNYTLNGEDMFHILSFDVVIVHDKKIIYTEHIKGSRYSETVKKTIKKDLAKYSDEHYRSTLYVKNIIIRDDLNNKYVMPDEHLEFRK